MHRKISTYRLLILACAALPLVGFAQPSTLELSHLPELSQAAVQAVVQDADGLIWLGTSRGLYSYDGYQAVPFWNDVSASSSLSENQIEALQPDSSGTLWVGTRKGLFQFGAIEQRFEAAPGHVLRDAYVTALQGAPDGDLWIGTYDGLFRLETGSTSSASDRLRPESSLAAEQISALLRDADGRLWVGTFRNGLKRLDPGSGSVEHWRHDPEIPHSLAHDAVRSLFLDDAGNLWIGTNGGGLSRLDPDSGVFTNYRHDPSDPRSLGSDQVRAIAGAPGGPIWIGTWGGGISAFRRESGHFVRYPQRPDHPAGLTDSLIRTLTVDAGGVLWIGSRSGLSKYAPPLDLFTRHTHDSAKNRSLSHDDISAIDDGRDGRLWIGTYGGGLNVMDPETGDVSRYRPDARDAELPDNEVWDVLAGSSGRVWTATRHGLRIVDPVSGTMHDVPIDTASSGGRLDLHVTSITQDADAMLWIGTYGGSLIRYDPETGRASAYDGYIHGDEGLGGNPVLTLAAEPSERVIWIGTTAGLGRLDLAGGAFTRFRHVPADPLSISHNFVFSILPAHDGEGVWVGTWTGLNYFDASTQSFRHHAGPAEMRTTVYDIAGGGTSSLWLRVPSGIIRYDDSTGEYWHYEDEYDIIGNDLRPAPLFRSSDGVLYSGGQHGLAAFRPPPENGTAYSPPVALTNLLIGDEPAAKIFRTHRFRHAARDSVALQLEPDQNSLSFEFALLDYREPGANRFAYRLVGHDNSWRYSNERRVEYASLPPGAYRLEVKGAGRDGLWSRQASFSLPFVIQTPLLQQRWFQLLLLFGLIGLAAALFQVRVRRIEAQNRALEAQVSQRTAELATKNKKLDSALTHLKATQARLVHAQKMASIGELTAGIAHEIKNPLNFVNNFSELSIDLAEELQEVLESLGAPPAEACDLIDEIVTQIKANARRVQEHGSRANAIVENMMMHARGAPDRPQATDVNPLVEEHVNLAYHGMRAQHDGFHVEIERDYDPETGSADLVPQEIGRVLINLLNNALHAAHVRAAAESDSFIPQVRVSTRREAGDVVIRVRDNGSGIPAHQREKIFEPFFTTKPAGTGTGLGLSLSYSSVVHGHGGQLSVDSEEGGFTELVVRLPVHAAVLHESPEPPPAAQ